MVEQHGAEESTRPSGTRARRAVGVALLVAAAGAAFLFSYDSSFYTCEHTTGMEAADTCKPPGVELLALLFLPALIVFAPDIQEFSIFGIGVTKADVDAAKKEAVEARHAAARAVSVTVKLGASSLEDLQVAAVEEGLAGAEAPVEGPQLPAREAFREQWHRLEPFNVLARTLRSASGAEARAVMEDRTAPLPSDLPAPLARVPRPLEDQTMEELIQWRQEHDTALAVLEAAALEDAALTDDDLHRLTAAARNLASLLPEPLASAAV